MPFKKAHFTHYIRQPSFRLIGKHVSPHWFRHTKAIEDARFFTDRELFDENYSYVDRPTEIEAYQCTVKEARKIGMADDAIAEYLYVVWITRKEHARLLKTLGIRATPP